MYNSIVFCIFDPKLGIMTRLLTFICLFVVIAHVQAKSSQEVEVRANGVVTRVIFFSPEIVRVVKCPGEPKGTYWYDFWTGARLKGGQEVSLQTTFDRVPMFVRAGSILPLGPEMQYVVEYQGEPITVKM